MVKITQIKYLLQILFKYFHDPTCIHLTLVVLVIVIISGETFLRLPLQIVLKTICGPFYRRILLYINTKIHIFKGPGK